MLMEDFKQTLQYVIKERFYVHIHVLPFDIADTAEA